MSRRNQARRRRSYGRRQHEVRERRGGRVDEPDWQPAANDRDWLADADDRSRDGGESFMGYSQ